MHAESTSYGISRPELDLATCYLHAPLASQDLTHGYAGPISLEPSDIYVNDEDVRFLEEEKTVLKPGDTLAIIPAIAGG